MVAANDMSTSKAYDIVPSDLCNLLQKLLLSTAKLALNLTAIRSACEITTVL